MVKVMGVEEKMFEKCVVVGKEKLIGLREM